MNGFNFLLSKYKIKSLQIQLNFKIYFFNNTTPDKIFLATMQSETFCFSVLKKKIRKFAGLSFKRVKRVCDQHSTGTQKWYAEGLKKCK